MVYHYASIKYLIQEGLYSLILKESLIPLSESPSPIPTIPIQIPEEPKVEIVKKPKMKIYYANEFQSPH